MATSTPDPAADSPPPSTETTYDRLVVVASTLECVLAVLEQETEEGAPSHQPPIQRRAGPSPGDCGALRDRRRR
jgi:hypothetical protein